MYILYVCYGTDFASVSTKLKSDFGSSDFVGFFVFHFFLNFDYICYSLHECLKSFSYDNEAEILATPLDKS